MIPKTNKNPVCDHGWSGQSRLESVRLEVNYPIHLAAHEGIDLRVCRRVNKYNYFSDFNESKPAKLGQTDPPNAPQTRQNRFKRLRDKFVVKCSIQLPLKAPA